MALRSWYHSSEKLQIPSPSQGTSGLKVLLIPKKDEVFRIHPRRFHANHYNTKEPRQHNQTPIIQIKPPTACVPVNALVCLFVVAASLIKVIMVNIRQATARDLLDMQTTNLWCLPENYQVTPIVVRHETRLARP